MPVRHQYQPIGTVLSDVTGARALNVDYQNTTGRPLLVIASIACNTQALNASAYAAGQIDTVTPAVVTVCFVGIFLKADAAQLTLRETLVFMVPQGSYYHVATAVMGVGSTVTLLTWFEVPLIAPFGAGF